MAKRKKIMRIAFALAAFIMQSVQAQTAPAKLVDASSHLVDSQGDYAPGNVVDYTYRSWAEGVKGPGIGEYVELASYNDDYTIAGFALKNGYGDLNFYAKNNRVKSFKIYVDGVLSESIAVKDSIFFEQYAFKTPIRGGAVIRFAIESVYPGTDFDDTCIAEICFMPQMADPRIFYDNILFWAGSPFEDGGTMYTEKRLAALGDVDKLLLIDYLPFDIPYYQYVHKNGETENWQPLKTKIARLSAPSTLRLTDNLPRLDGATALYPLYSAFVRAVYPEPPVINKGEPFYTFANEELFKWPYFPTVDLFKDDRESWWYLSSMGYESYEDAAEKMPSIVQCNKTPNAYQRLIDGKTDIVFCYAPSEAEIKAAAEKGLQFHLTPIAKDAFVFLVNSKNIASNLTTVQVRGIYSGRITSWKSITGVDDFIIPYQRSENSGSQTILQSIMKGDRLMPPILDGEYVSSGMFGYLRAIASDYFNFNSAIGYSFLFYVKQMAGSTGIKALSIDGVAPNKQNIQNGKYPFSQIVYAVTIGSESENTKKFLAWILSSQGQELVEKTGYTPIK